MRVISGKFSAMCLTVLIGIVLTVMGAQFMSGTVVVNALSLSVSITGNTGITGAPQVPEDDRWG
ncbi:hypothetical protein GCM10010347_51630 [Streptomyces cirratus]|uniref:Secreted protein n=2 Tax=Streptomyces cirratus TaxID=68187 RepID=A0ABQ3EYR5_9ACTN|nr:hypothetical protein GCM10010347_51630 [Streptomyces cirratus]